MKSETDKIAFTIADELGLVAEYLCISERDEYKYIFADESYVAIRITGSNFHVGAYRKSNNTLMSGIFANTNIYDLNDPNLLNNLKEDPTLIGGKLFCKFFQKHCSYPRHKLSESSQVILFHLALQEKDEDLWI
jgi:hypothetical protein